MPCTTCAAEQGTNSTPLLVCGRCNEDRYCSTECQKLDWPSHKKKCRNPASSLPQIVVLQLENRPSYDDICGRLKETLEDRANVHYVSSAQVASDILTGTDRPAIYVTNAALTQQRYRKQRDEAIAYVRSGGTMIFGGFFSFQIAPPKMNEFWGCFELPWGYGDCYRTETDLNTSMNISHAGLVQRYSQKAVNLVNVRREDALYLPSASLGLQSMVIAGTPIDDLTQTPVALASFGDGKVGYTGDVNGEEGTDMVVLAFLGLNAW